MTFLVSAVILVQRACGFLEERDKKRDEKGGMKMSSGFEVLQYDAVCPQTLGNRVPNVLSTAN